MLPAFTMYYVQPPQMLASKTSDKGMEKFPTTNFFHEIFK
jgi:hypothetical protein